MIYLLCAALALACAALAVALRRARRAVVAAEIVRDALGREVNLLRSRPAPAPVPAPVPAPTRAPAPPPVADFVTALYTQRLPPLMLKRPLAAGEWHAGFAVRWGLA